MNFDNCVDIALVTQAKLQHRPNCTELRSMDSYNQIFSRFQKYKQKAIFHLTFDAHDSPGAIFIWKWQIYRTHLLVCTIFDY